MTERVTKSIIVKSDISEAFDVWADFESFPYFMDYVNHVARTGPRTSHWEVLGPMGMKLEWDAETTTMEPDKRIAWNTKNHEGSITTSGDVVFSELPDNQTHITVTMNYSVPGGKVGEAIGKLFSDPNARLEEDLRNYKSYIENGNG